jgi:hypothetical protein
MLYGDTVDFFGKQLARDEVMVRKRQFASRWPARVYTVEHSSVQETCEVDGSFCSVTGIVYWNVRSEVRQATSTGKANFSFKFSMQGGQPLIVGEGGNVISKWP